MGGGFNSLPFLFYVCH
ncbi:MAG: CRISPR-associated DxTHG motif protein [candidate division Zixibacteria bacterium]|nr:CRISPR-associated DxTHG motif protein [candidate division Zixibacteria bacterium]